MHAISKTTKPGSIVEITGTLGPELLIKERAHMLEILGRQVSVDGFRAGSVPEAMLVAKVGEDYIKEKTAEHALEHELHNILVENTVLPIVPPQISVKLNTDGSAAVTITATVYPTITLPDYKQIAKDVMAGRTEISVSEADVLEALTHFRRERMRIELVEQHRTDEGTLTAEEKELLKTVDETSVESLPPLDDAFVKQIGFESVEKFEEHVKKELHSGKKEQERSMRRAQMLKTLCEKPIADVPQPLIEYEFAKMDAGLADYLKHSNKTLEEYYAALGKTRAEVHAEWLPEATKRAEHQLVLIEIAKREKISEDETELAALVADVLKRQPDAERSAVETHYQVILRNEKVLSWLENQ